MTPQDKRAAEANAARARLIRLSRVGSWIMLALVAGGSLWSDPELVVNPVFVGLTVAFVVGVLVAGRTALVTTAERPRLALEQTIAVAVLAALLVVAGPHMRALTFLFVLPVVLAPMLLGLRFARAVLGCAMFAAAVVAAASWTEIGRPVLVEVIAACGLFAIAHYVMAQLVQLFAAVGRSIQSQVDRDSLTGAYNFATFSRLGQRLHERAAETRQPYGVLIVDIDDLKHINDRFGYAAGSRAIRLVATALERSRRPDEFIARYDGDKLAVFVPQLEGSRASELAQRIRNIVFATTLNVDTEVVRIKANVGIARYPIDGTTLDKVLVKAEADMRIDRAGRKPPKHKPVFKRRSGTRSG